MQRVVVYIIERTPYGLKIVFEGFIKTGEMRNWVKDSEKTLSSVCEGFGALIDGRELEPLPLDSQTILQKGQILYLLKGLERSALVFNNSVIKAQFLKPHKSAIYKTKRFINATENSDWEKIALDWIIDSIEPLAAK